jgi:hypothetical protein
MDNFTSSTEAILELVDNAVSDRIPGKLLEIEIKNDRNFFTISNRYGYGMGIDDIENFLDWGVKKDRREYDIGYYSQGGKAAIGSLGDEWSLVSSSEGEYFEWRIEEKSWRSGGTLKVYSPKSRSVNYSEGFVEIKIKKWKKSQKDIRILEDKLKTEIATVYRPLILDKRVVFKFNGEVLQVIEFPLDKDYKIQNFDIECGDGKRVHGWIGRRSEDGQGTKGGIRCYSKGRLCSKSEFFDHPGPDYKHTLNYLFGEAHLDFVRLNMNKTNFLRDSEEWKIACKVMHDLLEPHIKELLSLKSSTEPTKEDEEAAREATEAINYLHHLSRQLDLRRAEEEGSLVESLFPSEEGVPVTEDISILKDFLSTLPRSTKPPTPTTPNSEAQVEDPIVKEDDGPSDKKAKTLYNGMIIKVRPLGETIRCCIVEEKGQHLILVNNLFPAYKTFKGNLTLYIIESAYMQLIKRKNGTIGDFMEEFDAEMSRVCIMLPEIKKSVWKIIKNKKR